MLHIVYCYAAIQCYSLVLQRQMVSMDDIDVAWAKDEDTSWLWREVFSAANMKQQWPFFFFFLSFFLPSLPPGAHFVAYVYDLHIVPSKTLEGLNEAEQNEAV